VHADDDLPSRVYHEEWAKEAVTYGYQSVLSVPLVYDDVLYGVLTGYAADRDAFTGVYEDLFADVASILGTYDRILRHRYASGDGEFVELDLSLADRGYPLHALATATDAAIRFESVVTADDESTRLLVTVTDGDPARVVETGDGVPGVVGVDYFGSPDDPRLAVSVETPFLATEVERHGGRLVASETEPAEGGPETDNGGDERVTRVRIRIPVATPHRPFVEFLTSRYRGIDLVAKRQATESTTSTPDLVDDVLTERQREVIETAYAAGYYETPRGITGEKLADRLGISSPAVYNHLQAAHSALLDAILE
jgi:DNA-binding CsgD family transcriptional regulator